MLSLILNKTAKNIAYKMLNLEEQLSGNFNPQINSEPSVVDIKHLFPQWVMDRYSTTSNVNSFMVNFVQSYYDWLYSSQGYGFGEYQLGSVPFLQLLDIDETPKEFLKHYVYSYASGFPDSLFEFDENATNENIELVRDFIRGVRTDFYQRKGTEESYEYFFRTLYGVENFQGNWIEYPKKYILRLNGGVPYGMQSGIFEGDNLTQIWETGFGWRDPFDDSLNSGVDYDYIGNLNYSALNVHVIQDSYWYQDFSYIIKTDHDPENRKTTDENGNPIYVDTLKELLHPAGLQAFYEVTLDDYIPPEDYDEDFNVCEEPVLGNYFPYRLSSNESLGLTACVGCSGSPYAYDGQGYEHAVDDVLSGFSGATFDMPTHFFPNWSRGISCDKFENVEDPYCIGVREFGNIYIGDLVFLCDADDSPNFGRTGCTGPRPGEVTNDCNAGQCWNC